MANVEREQETILMRQSAAPLTRGETIDDEDLNFAIVLSLSEYEASFNENNRENEILNRTNSGDNNNLNDSQQPPPSYDRATGVDASTNAQESNVESSSGIKYLLYN